MDCAIRTDDAMVSRHHARVYWGGDLYYVEDLGSANGVFFQEQRVTRHGLNHGDAVRCGSLWLRFVDTSSGQGQAQPQAMPPPHAPEPVRPQAAPLPPVGPARPPQPAFSPPTPSAAVQSAVDSARAEADADEIKRLNRRIEQLQTELRFYRGGKGADVAQQIEDLENENSSLENEMSQLKVKVKELSASLEAERGDVKVIKAGELATKTGETVQQLNDILSNLRINVMAAEGEFEQFSHEIPRASFELIREALRSSSSDVDTARELLRVLREFAD